MVEGAQFSYSLSIWITSMYKGIFLSGEMKNRGIAFVISHCKKGQLDKPWMENMILESYFAILCFLALSLHLQLLLAGLPLNQRIQEKSGNFIFNQGNQGKEREILKTQGKSGKL